MLLFYDTYSSKVMTMCSRFDICSLKYKTTERFEMQKMANPFLCLGFTVFA